MFCSKTFIPNIAHSNKWITSQLKIMMSQPKRRKQNVCVSEKRVLKHTIRLHRVKVKGQL